MKKITVISIVFIFALFCFISCEKKPAAPEAGTAKAEDLLSLIPVNAQGVFCVDIHRAMSTEVVNKSIKEDKTYEKIEEFIEKTGIDPQKDIYFVVGAITAGAEPKKQKGVGIINLKYNKDTLLALAKEKAAEEEQELTEEEYNGIMIYAWKEEDGEGSLSFIDDSNIVVGNESEVKSVIDVLQKRAENVSKNEDLSALIAKANKSAIFWGAILIPPEAMEEAAAENPFLSNLQAVNAVSIYFDYKNRNILTEIKVMSSDEAKNKQVADAITGLKAFGAMAAAQKPEIGELMDTIEISSGTDHVKIFASIPEELIIKLKDMKKEGEEEKEDF